MQLAPTQIEISTQDWVCNGCGGRDHKSCSCNSTAHAEDAAAKRQAHRIAARASKQRKAQQNQDSVDNQPTVETIEELGTGVRKWVEGAADYPPDYQSPWAAHGKSAPWDETDDLPEKVQQSNKANVFRMNCYASVQVAHFDGPVDDTIIKACHDAAQAWAALLTQLKEQHHG